MKRGGAASLLVLAGLCSACTIERIGPPGVTITRPVYVKTGDVRVFESLDDIRGPYTIMEEIGVDDDGETSAHVLVRNLRQKAGGMGANAIVLRPPTAGDQLSQVVVGLLIGEPVIQAEALAIWTGEGPPPVRILGQPTR